MKLHTIRDKMATSDIGIVSLWLFMVKYWRVNSVMEEGVCVSYLEQAPGMSSYLKEPPCQRLALQFFRSCSGILHQRVFWKGMLPLAGIFPDDGSKAGDTVG